MSFSRLIQWYHSHVDPIWPDGTFNSLKVRLRQNPQIPVCRWTLKDSCVQVYDESNGGIFRVDDVFVTGMLAERANVSHRCCIGVDKPVLSF